MCLKTPSFWYDTDMPTPFYMNAFSIIYNFFYHIHQKSKPAYKAKIPVICVGNIVAGGSGKTPITRKIYDDIKSLYPNKKICILSRGYKGKLKGPLIVNPIVHSANDVGDEPLMLSNNAEVIISTNRKKGARLAEKNGFDLIIMDDGLQNPGIYKDISIVVIDGHNGFGNEKLIPAGPLRESLKNGLSRANAFIINGNDSSDIKTKLPKDIPVFQSHIKSKEGSFDNSFEYVAFAGIAHPKSFEQSLNDAGIKYLEFHAFADHHNYTEKNLSLLSGARLITTEKDYARLPKNFIKDNHIDVLKIEAVWADKTALQNFLSFNINF